MCEEVGNAILHAAREFVSEGGSCTLISCSDNFWFLPNQSDRTRLGLVLYQARWINQTGVALALDNRRLWADEDRESQIFAQVVIYASIVEELARLTCDAHRLEVQRRDGRREDPHQFVDYIRALRRGQKIPANLASASHQLRIARNKIHVKNRNDLPDLKRGHASSAVIIYKAFRLVIQDLYAPNVSDQRRTDAALADLSRVIF